jgi:quinoprotein glucose dehydrogenase
MLVMSIELIMRVRSGNWAMALPVVCWNMFSLAYAAAPSSVSRPEPVEVSPRVVADWPAFAHDLGATRHSPARELTPDNVAGLEMAWTYRTGDYRLGVRGGRFEATPLMIDGTLYLSTPFGRVIALNPETGVERWNYDPVLDFSGHYGDWANRGVSSWLDQRQPPGRICRHRILVATVDARLIALDANTGRPCQDFGAGGTVDLTRDLPAPPRYRGEYQVTSPPAIAGDLVIVGSAIADNGRADAPSGVVRAFDARTGELRWAWDPIPRDPARRLSDSWLGESAMRTGAANAWAPMAVDAERGLVFVPTGSPSPDYFGGERPGRNDYANSVVALRAATGDVVWSFQVVHHDLWDYDVPAQPVLVELHRNGPAVPALVQATKMGHLFVLHRDTGMPLFGVEERAVPASSVAGEAAWPTQPFPVLPLPIVPQRLVPEEAWGITERDRLACRQRIAGLRWEGMFTPPSLEGTLVYPGNLGGSNWGGVSYDPVRGLLFAPANRLAAAVRLVPRDRLAEAGGSWRGAETALQLGTPYAMQREFLLSPSGLPCNPPPWGTLTAVDLRTGQARWTVPLGSMSVPGADRTAADWGSLNLGGAMSTSGGLVFASGGFDEHLHAFDAEAGRRLWSARLPAGGNAGPMTYLGPSGRQFVVIAAGGHDRMRTTAGDFVVAFALPDRERRRASSGSTASLTGRYEGYLTIGGDGRFPVSLDLRATATGVSGELNGALVGTGSVTPGDRDVHYRTSFTLAGRGCTGVLEGTLERANGGHMLVGPVHVSGECSGQEELGVLALRRMTP